MDLENPIQEQPEAEDPRLVKSVARAITLMKVMAKSDKPMSLKELAAAVGLSRPSTFYLLRTLAHEGLIAKTADGAHELSWGLWELGASVSRSADLVKLARPHLDHVARVTGEAVLLSVLDGSSVIYVDRGQTQENFTMVANIGVRSSLHANASGKLLLAHGGEPLIEHTLDGALYSFTSTTITEPTALASELATIRKRGFATCWQEQELGISSLAVPVRDVTGSVVAAMALAGPSGRVNKGTSARLLKVLRAEVDKVSGKLGWSVERTAAAHTPRASTASGG